MTEIWDVTVQEESAFLQGWSVEFTFGEELLMEHALCHHSHREGVCTWRTGWPTQVLSPTPRMQMGTCWRVKLVRTVSFLEGHAEAQHVCDV